MDLIVVIGMTQLINQREQVVIELESIGKKSSMNSLHAYSK